MPMQAPHINNVVNAHARLVSVRLAFDAYPNQISNARRRLQAEATQASELAQYKLVRELLAVNGGSDWALRGDGSRGTLT